MPSLASALKVYLSGKGKDESAFVMPDRTNLARMLRVDLEACKIAPTDSSGRTVDFHALRHSYISLMARAGVAPKVLMDLARHSDVNLTMGYYSHTLMADRAEALKSLPDLIGPEPKQQMRATGTYDTVPIPVDFAGENAKQNANRENEDAQVIGPCRIRTYDQWIMSPLL